jgi:hypothetical protein
MPCLESPSRFPKYFATVRQSLLGRIKSPKQVLKKKVQIISARKSHGIIIQRPQGNLGLVQTPSEERETSGVASFHHREERRRDESSAAQKLAGRLMNEACQEIPAWTLAVLWGSRSQHLSSLWSGRKCGTEEESGDAQSAMSVDASKVAYVHSREGSTGRRGLGRRRSQSSCRGSCSRRWDTTRA